MVWCANIWAAYFFFCAKICLRRILLFLFSFLRLPLKVKNYLHTCRQIRPARVAAESKETAADDKVVQQGPHAVGVAREVMAILKGDIVSGAQAPEIDYREASWADDQNAERLRRARIDYRQVCS